MGSDEDVPFYLMPVAAVFGMYTVIGAMRALYLLYANLSSRKNDDSTLLITPLKSRAYGILVVSVVVAAVMYAKVVAWVDNALVDSDHALFDPYDILSIPTNANSTIVKKAYFDLSKLHHPDKGGNQDKFHQIHLAYRALSDDFDNYQKYGHPDGPVQHHALSFALPEWLLHPEGTTAVVLIGLYLTMFAGLIYVVVTWSQKTTKQEKEREATNSVASADVAYLANKLSPKSTHMDVLFYIATTPESIDKTLAILTKTEVLKKERLEKKKLLQKKTLGFDLLQDNDEGGWAEDDDDDNEDEGTKAALLKAKQAEEELAREKAQRIAAATGNQEVLYEGIDEGVLGQEWVERTLQAIGQWPPPFVLEEMTFSYNSKTVSALEHPAVRRNLCMTMGRLNSQHLNTHSELLQAGSKKLIDGTYFRSSMEYRQRCGLLLEACLRIAMMAGSYRLAKTIVETVSMFKVGVTSHDDESIKKAYLESMKKQYGGEKGVPRLEIKNYSVSTEDEDEMATGDISMVQLEMERTHAEHFTKQKIALCQKQGIPPEVALKAYQEGWWILVRAKRLDSKDVAPTELKPNNPLAKMLLDQTKFLNEIGENRLITAWPLIVQNVAQKGGKVKIQFKAPDVPGRYRFYVAIKSQEFLGADTEFTVDTCIVDAADVKRKEEADEEEEEQGDDETKKDK